MTLEVALAKPPFRIVDVVFRCQSTNEVGVVSIYCGFIPGFHCGFVEAFTSQRIGFNIERIASVMCVKLIVEISSDGRW